MKKTFVINGGAGRVICAIPALEKYARLNPDSDFNVVIHGWESLYWSHPLLQNKTYGIQNKGIFEQVFKDTDTVCPEPYFLHGYYNQELSMAEAFDKEINLTDDHSDLEKPNLYLSSLEINSARHIIKGHKDEKKKLHSVVVQPYGSGMRIMNERPFDTSHRSLDVDQYLHLVKELSNHAIVYFFGPPELRHPGDEFSVPLMNFNPDLRMFMSLISETDYFIGCDSVGQHMARAFNKEGTIFMGSTFEENVSYPDHFDIIRKEGHNPVYNPIRFGGVDSDLIDRMNDGILNIEASQFKEVVDDICSRIYTLQ